jgi:hypothetical protein
MPLSQSEVRTPSKILPRLVAVDGSEWLQPGGGRTDDGRLGRRDDYAEVQTTDRKTDIDFPGYAYTVTPSEISGTDAGRSRHPEN